MKKLYIAVDVQNDSITGTLGSEWAQRVTPKIAEYLKQVKGKPDTYEIWATRDTHYGPNARKDKGEIPYDDTLEGEKLPVPHCIKNTPGWAVEASVDAFVDIRVDKYTFMSETLGRMVLEHQKAHAEDDNKLDEIILMGFCTSTCVVSNALYLRGLLPNMKITVVDALCADVSEEAHRSALDVMRNCQIDIKEDPVELLQDVEANVIRLAATYNTNSDCRVITTATHLYEDLLFDDLDKVMIIITLEEEYNICISDEEESKILTIGDLVDTVKSLLSKQHIRK